MKRFKLKLHAFWQLLFADEWCIYTDCAAHTFKGSYMKCGKILDYHKLMYERTNDEIMNIAQEETNLKEVVKILNGDK